MEEYIQMVEEALRKLGLSPEEARQGDAPEWWLQVDKYPVWIDIYPVKEYYALYVRSVVLENISRLPNENQMLRFLLEQNAEIMDAAWTIQNDRVLLRSFRPMKRMNSDSVYEVLRLMEAILVNLGKEIEFLVK